MGESGHYVWYSEKKPVNDILVPNNLDLAIGWLGEGSPKILYLTPEYPDYQADLLFHGLVKVLGRHLIVSHPYRAQYNAPEDFEPSPNLAIVHFRLGTQWRYTNDEIVELVKKGIFDYIFVSRPYFPDEPLQLILQRLMSETDAQFVVLDDDSTLTDMDSLKHMVTRVLGGRVLAYFMKEIYQVKGAFPLQFAYPEEMSEGLELGEEHHDLSFNFVCKPVSTVRMEISEALMPLVREYPTSVVYVKDPPIEHNMYRDIVRRSKISVNAKGTKFDCPRIYEIPMLGSMLISHRLLIDQDKPFIGGEHCVYFDSIEELPDLIRYYLRDENKEERLEITEKGREHAMKHHTTEARARQVLDVLKSVSGNRA